MFSKKPSGNGANGNAKKPTIRRETVLVPVKKQQNPNGVSKPAPPSVKPSANRFKLSERSGAKPAPLTKKPTTPAQKVIAANRGAKRKSTTPDRVIFSSDEEGDSSDGASDSDLSRKRMKRSTTPEDDYGPRRDLVLAAAFEKQDDVQFLHGAECTSGEYEAKFKNPWAQEDFEIVELQYPSNSQRERFELKWPKNEKDDYKPMEDIIETIKQIANFYFPAELRAKYTDESTGFGRLFSRAWVHQSIPEFKSIIESFNAILAPLVEDGTTQRELASHRRLPLELVTRITEQIYSRTVSPKVETLRAYENGSDNVYGELRERFCSTIFKQTKLNHEHVFMDLGSGVGNVVLQAALEIGCESWGIEMMPNPNHLAELQAKEFPGRSHLWGIKVGDVHLIEGDLRQENSDIDRKLQIADVVLVNNQAFTPALNDTLRNKFLDLKDGAQVVSLKPIFPEGHKISNRTNNSVANLFTQKKFEYFSGSVSWTDHSGHYYIATKDPRPYEKYLRERSAR